MSCKWPTTSRGCGCSTIHHASINLKKTRFKLKINAKTRCQCLQCAVDLEWDSLVTPENCLELHGNLQISYVLALPFLISAPTWLTSMVGSSACSESRSMMIFQSTRVQPSEAPRTPRAPSGQGCIAKGVMEILWEEKNDPEKDDVNNAVAFHLCKISLSAFNKPTRLPFWNTHWPLPCQHTHFWDGQNTNQKMAEIFFWGKNTFRPLVQETERMGQNRGGGVELNLSKYG